MQARNRIFETRLLASGVRLAPYRRLAALGPRSTRAPSKSLSACPIGTAIGYAATTPLCARLSPRGFPASRRTSLQHQRAITTSAPRYTTMGVTKTVITPGDGVTKAKAGDQIIMEYTGNLHDPNAPNGKGQQFDSSVGRGDFKTQIGVGQVIKGWDEGVLSADGGMTLGEKATLVITGDYAYGSRGFPGLIPPNATLVFDVQLKAINGKRM